MNVAMVHVLHVERATGTGSSAHVDVAAAGRRAPMAASMAPTHSTQEGQVAASQ